MKSVPARFEAGPPHAPPRRTTLMVVALVLAAGVSMAARPLLVDAVWPGIAGRRATPAYQAVVQAGGLVLAALTLLVAFRLSAGRIRAYWGLGAPGAPARRVRWLGIREGVSWRRVGSVMLVWISVLLGGFLYLGLAKDLSRGPSAALLSLALLFAVTNCVTEEVIFRLVPVGVLRGLVGDGTVLAVSAGIFGLVHVVGVPGGPIGIVMAGFLGWFLARSIMETHGMFWAILIHLVQDVIIFSFLLHL